MSKLLADPDDVPCARRWDGRHAVAGERAWRTHFAVKASPAVGSATVTWLPPDAGTAGHHRRHREHRACGRLGSTADGQRRPLHRVTRRSPGSPTACPTRHCAGAQRGRGLPGRRGPRRPSCRRTRRRSPSIGASVLSYGATSTVTAVLTSPTPTRLLASAPVKCVNASAGDVGRGSGWLQHRRMTTGRVSQAVTAGHNLEVRFSYAGDIGMQPASVVKTIWVRRLLSLTATVVQARRHATHRVARRPPRPPLTTGSRHFLAPHRRPGATGGTPSPAVPAGPTALSSLRPSRSPAGSRGNLTV